VGGVCARPRYGEKAGLQRFPQAGACCGKPRTERTSLSGRRLLITSPLIYKKQKPLPLMYKKQTLPLITLITLIFTDQKTD
jgi:hypothetical protein